MPISIRRRATELATQTLPPTRVWYLGIDPGNGGGLAITDGNSLVTCKIAKTTEVDLWIAIRNFSKYGDVRAVIETQVPRPTRFKDRRTGQWVSSVLKSTCVLYARYYQLRAFLIACAIPFDEATPQKWQKVMMPGGKSVGEKTGPWKNRCKARGQELFPGIQFTLPVADAVLIADYCRRINIAER